jgi:transcriptional regulator with XRE-family HTH domain
VAHPIDRYVGNRMRLRRRFLGMTQQGLAEAVGIRFQQIQKYESGANRISASRLWELSNALGTPIPYFYEGLREQLQSDPDIVNGDHDATIGADPFKSNDTMALVRAFYTMNAEPRRRLLDLAKAMSGGS